MFSAIEFLFDTQTLIQAVGLIGITLIIFAESGLFFGFFFPGDSLLFTAGVLASQGFINIWLLVFLTTIAAIAGDSVGYWFGKKVGPILFVRPDSFLFSHQRVVDAKRFFEKHGAKSLILARFVPGVRTFTPIIAGVGGMPYKTFLTYNVIGAILWAFCIPLLGYFLGSTIPGIDKYIVPIVLLIIAVSFIPLIREVIRSYIAKHPRS